MKRTFSRPVEAFIIALIFSLAAVVAFGEIMEGRNPDTSSGFQTFEKKRITVITLTQGTNISVTAIPINSGGVIYTHSFGITDGDKFALGYCLAGNNTTIDIQLEQGVEAPTTEGSADARWAVPAGWTNISVENTTVQGFSAVTPLFVPYGRIKVTGTAGDNTTMNATWSVQNSL